MNKLSLIFILLMGVGVSSSACPSCNQKIMEGIYNSQFYHNLFTMMSAFVVMAIIVVVLSAHSAKRHKTRVAANPNEKLLSPVPLTTTALVLGIGMGGFFDGILLHQILQQHEMLSNIIPATEYIGKSINMFWDGIFHFFNMLIVLVGIFLMWKLLFRKDIDSSGKLLIGGLLMGWGLFNIVEGVINHHILKLHNVNELSHNHDIGNFAFLGISAVMLIVGFVIVATRKKIAIKTD